VEATPSFRNARQCKALFFRSSKEGLYFYITEAKSKHTQKQES